jgi:transposase-like protein
MRYRFSPELRISYERKKMKSGKKSPRKFTPEFKLTTVLEAYATGNMTATAARHSVHITQLNKWKKQLLVNGSDIFKKKIKEKEEEQLKIDQYEKVIGRLALEVQILKKTQELIN